VDKNENSPQLMFYARDRSDQHHKAVTEKRKRQQVKIERYPKLMSFVKQHLSSQSLKGIGGRTKIEMTKGNIESSISSKTLYNYINNKHVE
jgi:hypothetical protein